MPEQRPVLQGLEGNDNFGDDAGHLSLNAYGRLDAL